MCILFFYVNDNPKSCPYKLIVAGNRDELITRPTECAAFRRGKQTEWVGGIDLVQGLERGSWLGISRSGKFAALLNVLTQHRPKKKPRGHLVPNFLENDITCEDYMESVGMRMDDFNGFQLFCINLRHLPDDQLQKQFEDVGNVEDIHYTSAIHMCTTENKYVTRCNTVILVDFDDTCYFYERTIESHNHCDTWGGQDYTEVAFEFKLDPA